MIRQGGRQEEDIVHVVDIGLHPDSVVSVWMEKKKQAEEEKQDCNQLCVRYHP